MDIFKFFRKLFVVFLFVFSTLDNSAYSQDEGEVVMDNNILMLLLEIKRVGTTEKWNSSEFFEGPLRVHVLKDGTVTNSGVYMLSSKKLGYPAVIKVNEISSKSENLTFVVSPGNKPIFKSSLSVPVKYLVDSGFIYNGMEVLESSSSIYRGNNEKTIYLHCFSTLESGKKIHYKFYSYDDRVNDYVNFIRLVVKFNN